MKFSLPITVLVGLICNVPNVHGRAHNLLRRHSIDTLRPEKNEPAVFRGRDLSDSAKNVIQNADKVTFVSITPEENNPEGVKNAIKNSMPGVSHNLLDKLGEILGGGQKQGADEKTTTLTVTKDATMPLTTPAKANIASGIKMGTTAGSDRVAPATRPDDAVARATAATNTGMTFAKQTGISYGGTNSSSPALLNSASSPAATGTASNGIENSASKDNKCSCSCLCGTGPMPNAIGMNSTPMPSASSGLIVKGTGNTLPNGECACSCFCPSGSFPGSGSMLGINAPSGVSSQSTSVAAAGTKATPEASQIEAPQQAPPQLTPQQPSTQEPAPQQPAVQEPPSQQPTSQQPAAQEPPSQQPAPQQPAAQEPPPEQPAPQQPQTQPSVTQSLVTSASVAVPSVAVSTSGSSVLNLPLGAAAGQENPQAASTTTIPLVAAAPEGPQNPNPINISSYKLSSSLLLGMLQPTPAP